MIRWPAVGVGFLIAIVVSLAAGVVLGRPPVDENPGILAVPSFVALFAGGYVAARIAKKIPYYHGLAIGVAGILFIFAFWPDDAGWLDWVGLLITIPLSLYGSHLAKGHITEEP